MIQTAFQSVVQLLLSICKQETMGVISKWIVLVWDGTDLSNRPYVTKIILEICSNYFLGCKPKMLVRFF